MSRGLAQIAEGLVEVFNLGKWMAFGGFLAIPVATIILFVMCHSW